MKISLKNQNISIYELKKTLSYCHKTGIFIWINPKSNATKIGSIAGHSHVSGYIYIKFNNIKYKAHRLAWFYHYGHFPTLNIDHINHDRKDNSIKNLREVSCVGNNRNKKLQKNSKSGHYGVYFKNNKWCARITVNYKIIELGRFLLKEDAIKKRKDAEKYHYFHPSHGL